jgi:hypothetical protein
MCCFNTPDVSGQDPLLVDTRLAILSKFPEAIDSKAKKEK